MTNVKLLRIYASNTDKVKHTSLYETLAFAAKRYGMAGVTVYKGIMGYGASSELVSDRFWELTEKTPVIIELIDDAEKIENFLRIISPWLEQLPKGCLVVILNTEIVLHRHGAKTRTP